MSKIPKQKKIKFAELRIYTSKSRLIYRFELDSFDMFIPLVPPNQLRTFTMKGKIVGVKTKEG